MPLKSPRVSSKKRGQKEAYNCRSCDEPDAVDDMVQCDQCNAWNHFGCAGVNASVKEKSYLCQNCTGKSRYLASFSGADSASVVGFAEIKANEKSQLPENMIAQSAYATHYTTQFQPSTATIITAQGQSSSSLISAPGAAEDAAQRGNLSTMNNPTHLLAAPTTAVHSISCSTVPVPSAAEVAAKRGNLSTIHNPTHFLSAASTTAVHSTSFSTVSAPSAAEVAAKCGNLSTVCTQKNFQPPTATFTATAAHTQASSTDSAHHAAEVAAMCGSAVPAPVLIANPISSYTFNTTATQSAFGLANVLPYSASLTSNHLIPSINKVNAPSLSALGTKSTISQLLHRSENILYATPRSKGSSSSRSSKFSSTKLRIELQKIEEERRLKENLDKEDLRLRKEREAEYLNKKYLIMSQAVDSSEEDDEADLELKNLKASNENVNDWIAGLPKKDNLHSTTMVENHPPSFRPVTSQHINTTRSIGARGPISSTLLPPAHHFNTSQSCFTTPNPTKYQQPPPFVPLCSEIPPTVNFSLPSQANATQQQPSFQTHQHVPSYNMDQHTRSNDFLTKSHLAARHLIRDLPTFDGNPSEWPLFIASFNRSTELGGFSNEENLLRLHRALKGDALEAVKSLIIQPNCVRRVIETLRMLYGRPELIINTLIRTISTTPSPKAERLETIVTFAIAVQNLCATFEVSGVFNNLNYPMLLQELVDKLPPTLRLNWAIHKQSLPTCTLADFSNWMYAMAEGANGVLVAAPSSSAEEKKLRNKSWKSKGTVNAHYKDSEQQISKSEKVCCICGCNCATVAVCKKFTQLSRTARWAEVRKHQLCRRCLKGHLKHRCKSEALCGKNNCILKHHPLLHNDEAQTESSSHNAGTVGIHSSLDCKTDPVLFRIVPVFLYGKGIKIKTYALLDDGSSVTLLDEVISRQLNVRGEQRPLCLKWTGNTSRLESQSELINLQISGTRENAEKFQLTNVHTVQKLALPAQTLNHDELQTKFEHLKGISFESFNRAVPRILIGVNNAQLGHPLKSKEGGWNEPIATKTRLGWVVHGNSFNEEKKDMKAHNFHTCDCNDLDLRKLVKDFICDDNFGTSESHNIMISKEDTRALELLKNHTIQKEGRYETTLLWRFDNVQLPASYPMAKRRLECLHKRMERSPDLAKILNDKIEEYVVKGYARKVTPQEISQNQSRSWYLPIFPVENANKPGKIRIVWDAAAAVRGTSLNSVLLKGPDQLTPLISVIYKFRQHKIAICGDIKEMFHQIKIRKEDQHYQRFLWGHNDDGKPDTYIMMVMTFGATCSPCTAHYVKNSNAEQFATEYPRAVLSIKENHYVDDLMDSVPTEEEAVKLAQEIRHIHKHGGFYIRNWVSNSPNVLKALGAEPTEQVSMNSNPEIGTEKVLGMWWCTSQDCITFKLTSNPAQKEVLLGSRRPTKREVLKVMMTIFDPLGLIACFLMYIKILLQEIWRSKIEWDDKIRDAEYDKWIKWTKHLSEVENVKIPRCYVTLSWGSDVQLHIFVDASENGYAAVAYVRNSDSEVTETSLIGAKTRVAPLKSLSIPRLELQAALLGARLAKCIAASHGIRFSRRVFWSDSKTVLSWLRSDHRRYRQFVAFRVSEILDLSDIGEWRWTPTNTNIADEATKWQRPPDLKPTSKWFNGPKFLKLSPDKWPKEIFTHSTIEELKTNFVGIHLPINQESMYRFKEISTWKKLLRSTAYVHRFIHNTSTKRIKLPKVSGSLSRNELRTAENNLIREAQIHHYAEEFADLAMNRCIQKSSPILNLNPFLDENRILRANGRISLAEGVSADVRQPIILPRWHKITSLIINDAHCRYKHQNDETVVNTLRERFYISHMRSALKSVKRSCQQCKNNKAQPSPPMMAPLPPARLASFCRPFSYVGVDYFGPMTVSIGRRTEKRWGVLLTCLTIRAVHIEVAHSLTTDSCILCIRNFIARRGTPIEFHSDNGTNFHGAERELREAAAAIQRERLVETFTTTVTQWKFIPPGSPHMGGSWERLVRSIKNVLYAIVPTRNPNDELLRSMLIEIENILNSRPLTYIPIDAKNPEALTPNHFLLGSACGSKPLVEFNDDIIVHRKNWLISQQFADRFWKRWVAEYLPTLTRRSKWFTPAKPLEVGDVALVVDPNNPRNCWPKGRIVKVKLSNDDQVRSAVIQTQNGVYERPAVKLAVLDVKAPENTSPQAELPRGSVNNHAHAA